MDIQGQPLSISSYGLMKVSMHPTAYPHMGMEAETIGPVKIIRGEDGVSANMPKGAPFKRSPPSRSMRSKQKPFDFPERGPKNDPVHPDTPLQHMIGDQPVYAAKAHVFYIEPSGSKKEWTPGAHGAVPVNMFYDTARQGYRIISIVDSKAIVNSALAPDSTFIKTSHKFGQWLDPHTGVLYGLGFSNESELDKFAKKFNQYKEDTSPPPPQHAVNNRYTPNGPGKIFPEEEDVIILDKPHGGLYSAPPDENSPVLRRRNDYGGGKGKEKYVDDDAMSRESEEAERLKAELDQSKNQLDNLSKENKKKEDEIGTLKKNNQKLTSALKESAANVEEWKKLLHKYREESLEAKNKISEIEAEHREKEHQLRKGALDDDRVQNLERTVRDKEREIDILNKELVAAQNEANRLQMDNNRLQDQVNNLNDQLDKKGQDDGRRKRENQELMAQMNGKIQELQIMGASLQSKI